MSAGIFETPLGPMVAVVDGEGALERLSFLHGRERTDPSAVPDAPSCRVVARQVQEYFDGRRRAFELALDPEGTPFQRDVWSALVKVPYGERASYSDIAEAVGRPEAVRAVGAANGANPIAIVIPCHRVLGRDGSLTGYGAGLPIKRWLLDHEAGMRPLPLPLAVSFAPRRRPAS
ncbi:MAG TPA: methylated-DNA--[protein]-cysteine S-methyltransferase [Thermoanaerobaculia bacterium]|jgi:methylated-DNA-[protein]-cysteine S-methyltransferase